MMKLENVGVVIASRELTLDRNQKVEVLIGKPEACPDESIGIVPTKSTESVWSM